MGGPSRKPLEGGPFDARATARRIQKAWRASGIPAKQIVERLGLGHESAWSKRMSTGRSDWVPLRLDELSIVAELLAPKEPWRFVLDDTASALLRDALARARGQAPEPATPLPAQASTAPVHRRKPSRRAGNDGGPP